MASKRTAGSDLNHTNWDQEDEPEKAGSFKKASEEVLQRRVIKTAKRRNPVSSDTDTDKKSVFGTFSGFSKTAATSTAFAFLNNISTPKDDSPSVNGVNNSPSVFTQPSSIKSNPMTKTEHSTSNENEDEYYAKLKGLNESVSNWIKKHVDSNPFINLKPIFKDYDKYFNDIEVLKSTKTDKTKSVASSNVKPNDDSSTYKKELSSFVFKSGDSVKETAENKAAMPQFSFGSNVDKKEKCVTFGAKSETDATNSFAFNKSPKAETTTSSFQFISNTVTASPPAFSFTKTTSSNFVFGNSNAKPFAFTNVAKPTNTEEQNEEDDDEPPKVEFQPVVEDGHTYTVKCKVFVKNQDNYGDRGVGTLYLKPVSGNNKTQLIVRADTNLGNLLCNFILSKSIPTKRMGKKDVMLVCLPTPDSKAPPVPILLRVKSPEQADELLAELEKHKK